MNACVFVVAISSLVCAFPISFTLLVVMRIICGAGGRRRFPGRDGAARRSCADPAATSGDRAAARRSALTANVLGASIAGVIGDLFGWRGVFLILGLFSLAAAIFLAFFALRDLDPEIPPPKRQRGGGHRELPQIFADPRARCASPRCSWEAIFIQGLFPFVPVCC